MEVAKEVLRGLTTRIIFASDRRSSVRVCNHRGGMQCPRMYKILNLQLAQFVYGGKCNELGEKLWSWVLVIDKQKSLINLGARRCQERDPASLKQSAGE